MPAFTHPFVRENAALEYTVKALAEPAFLRKAALLSGKTCRKPLFRQGPDRACSPKIFILFSNFPPPFSVYTTEAAQSQAPDRTAGTLSERSIDVTKEETLSQFLIETQTRSYRLAYSVLQNREEALDAVQTAVCRALERQDSLRDIGAVKTWFTRILMNTCSDVLRQRGRTVPFPEEGMELGGEDPEPADESLTRRVDALPAEVGIVIKLRFYEELTLKEIGEVTGQNINTVKSRLYAGLKKLRVAMEGAEI